MTRTSLRTISCMFVGGCAAASPAAPVVPSQPIAVSAPVVEVPAPAPTVTPAPIVTPAPVEDAEVVGGPPATVCAVRDSDWVSGMGRGLRGPSGRVYATIDRADELTLSTQGGAVVEFLGHGLRLRSRPRAGDFPVYARGELVFAGVVQAGPATPLGWTAIEGPRLRVALPNDRRVKFATPPAVEAECTALTLIRGRVVSTHADQQLRARGSLAVSLVAGGPPVAHLRLDRAVDVRVLVRADAYAKIAWHIEDGGLIDATVTGWIEGGTFAAAGNRAGSAADGGMGMNVDTRWTGCSGEHALYASGARGPELVGEILQGTRVVVGAARGKFVEVEVVGPAMRDERLPFKLRAGVEFLLAPDAANDCLP